ncbi:hypothetical protein NXG04_07580 [Klebsiella pneumoniae]|nr:hypothetical protein [Klebsiella pneumoniae]MDS7714414.1 hypothetical protein [Klebsiella pneumoniae]UUV46296.1 hypothetical protein [Bacillus phage vB_BanS-Thrax2]
MVTVRDFFNNITTEEWREALLRRKIGRVLDGHKNGWLTNDEAKTLIIKAFEQHEEYKKIIDKYKD